MTEDITWNSTNYTSVPDMVEGESLGSFPSAEVGTFLEPNVPKIGLSSTPVKQTGVPCFEEDTRSSWNFENTRVVTYKEAVLCEDSQNSVSSQKSVKKKFSDEEITSEGLGYIPPENIFEYQWPEGKGDFYMLQEQICEYLLIKSFKRKYPDLYRRSVEMDEKEFLKERGVVTETQADLGLTALRSEDVMELMQKDYPDKYHEYVRVLQEKERQTNLEKHRGYSTASIEQGKMAEFIKKAVSSAAEYNQHLNQERREERRSCFDLQTLTIQYPTGKARKLSKEDYVIKSRYPAAIIPGQFQDYYRVYTPQELKYLPVNTVLYGPPQELGSVYAQGSDGSESDDSSDSDGSCCSSSQGTHDGESSSGSEAGSKTNSYTCRVCHTEVSNADEIITCAECGKGGHPTCLDILPEMAHVIKSYRWQCMDCKMCNVCMATDNEDKMMFCDKCDRGYHSFCVGMKSVPSGRWICRLCGQCSGCGSKVPGPENPRIQWHHEYSKGGGLNRQSVAIYCQICYKHKRQRKSAGEQLVT